MRKLMDNRQFRTRFEMVSRSKIDVESPLIFSLLALAVRLYIKFQDVAPSFITLTEFLLYLEGQRDDEKAELWKRVYRDGPNVARTRQELEGAILAQEGVESLREKQRAFVDALTARSTLQSVSQKVYLEEELLRAPPECTGVSASWCPVCGDCLCPREEDGEWGETNESCPLHGFRSKHAERNPEREDRELLQSLIVRGLDQGKKPECRRCGAAWKQDGNTTCMVRGSGFDHDWVLEVLSGGKN